MRIQNQSLRLSWPRAAMAGLVSGLVCLGMAGSASAGTVYSWQTDDGTFAYTDDRKRIPERYRNQAKSRSMKQLSNYKRFTASSVRTEGDYAGRLNDRLDHLRDGGAIAMAAPGVASGVFLVRGRDHHRPTRIEVDRHGPHVRVPAGGSGGPVTVEEIRVRPDSVLGDNGSMATRHITVVRQDGRVISVTRPHHNQRGLDSPSERDLLE